MLSSLLDELGWLVVVILTCISLKPNASIKCVTRSVFSSIRYRCPIHTCQLRVSFTLATSGADATNFWVDSILKSQIDSIFLKIWAILVLFFLYFRFSKQKFADDWIRSADLWCRSQPLYRLSHNHCQHYSVSP